MCVWVTVVGPSLFLLLSNLVSFNVGVIRAILFAECLYMDFGVEVLSDDRRLNFPECGLTRFIYRVLEIKEKGKT